ncbi:hypothetical protein KU6B_51250 [Mameliella alba]|nr:hypothetical protein KU6B_51250 [Mameliella alba]
MAATPAAGFDQIGRGAKGCPVGRRAFGTVNAMGARPEMRKNLPGPGEGNQTDAPRPARVALTGGVFQAPNFD